MVDKTRSLLLLILITGYFERNTSAFLYQNDCINLCSLYQSLEDKNSNSYIYENDNDEDTKVSMCLNSCLDDSFRGTRHKDLNTASTDQDLESERDSEFKSPERGNKLSRNRRDLDEAQIIGPYHRRPHYLRIGRSSMTSQDDVRVKRARAAHYLRIGRDFNSDSRSKDEESELIKRGRPSHYLRIGRRDETARNEKRASHYMRIGRGSTSFEDEMGYEEQEKRARPAHYMRIGRLHDDHHDDDDLILSDDDGIENKKRAAKSYYMRMGREVGPSRDQRRSRQSHYLRIGRNSASFGSRSELKNIVPSSASKQSAAPELVN